MSVTTDELYATAEGLAIDEIASILYYQHLKAGKGDESAQWVYNLTMKELLPRDMMVKNMVDNEVSLRGGHRCPFLKSTTSSVNPKWSVNNAVNNNEPFKNKIFFIGRKKP